MTIATKHNTKFNNRSINVSTFSKFSPLAICMRKSLKSTMDTTLKLLRQFDITTTDNWQAIVCYLFIYFKKRTPLGEFRCRLSEVGCLLSMRVEALNWEAPLRHDGIHNPAQLTPRLSEPGLNWGRVKNQYYSTLICIHLLYNYSYFLLFWFLSFVSHHKTVNTRQ